MKSIRRIATMACAASVLCLVLTQTQRSAYAYGIPVLDVPSLIQNTIIARQTLLEVGISRKSLIQLGFAVEHLLEQHRLQTLTYEKLESVMVVLPEIQAYFLHNSSYHFTRTMPPTFVLFIKAIANGDIHAVIRIITRLHSRYPRADKFDPWLDDSWRQRSYADLQNVQEVSTVIQEQTYSELEAALVESNRILMQPAPTNATKLDRIAQQLHHSHILRVKALAAGTAAANLDAAWQRKMIEEQKAFVRASALMPVEDQ